MAERTKRMGKIATTELIRRPTNKVKAVVREKTESIVELSTSQIIQNHSTLTWDDLKSVSVDQLSTQNILDLIDSQRRYGAKSTIDYWRVNQKALSLGALEDHRQFEIKESEFRPQVESSGIICKKCGNDKVNFIFNTHRADEAQTERCKCSICGESW
jgi:DNA-directed RNA polymerase subunit M/transcription elongation factor TFIIS